MKQIRLEHDLWLIFFVQARKIKNNQKILGFPQKSSQD